MNRNPAPFPGPRLLASCLCAALVAAGSIGARAQPNGRPSTADTVRLLEQATFGQTPALVAHIEEVGIQTFLDEEFSAPRSDYPELPFWPAVRPARQCLGICERDNYTMYRLQVHFFNNALYGADQLRQRVAWGLAQVLVVGPPINVSSWMRPYQQILYANAFGNYRQVLYEITVNPTMGQYLDMLNSVRFNPLTGVKPNENYAREILQLFSIGLFELDSDGTLRLDEQGNPIPTYDQDTIEEFSRAFTGWTLGPQLPGPPEIGGTVPNYRDPMIVRQPEAQYHDTDEKQLLNGVVLPAGQTAVQDLNDAIDNIVEHSNVAPSLAKLLIQRLVTSNPSPDYIRRVAETFEVNRASKSQLQAVVRAILVDPEARGDERSEENYGHLREPVLFMTTLLRAFDTTSDGVLHSSLRGSPIGAAQMEQEPFRSPSVFNFFSPDYEIPGAPGVLGPEFNIFSSVTSLRRSNFVNQIVMNRQGIPPAPPDRPLGTQIDLSTMAALAGDPAALLDALDMLLLHGTMTPEMRDIITRAVVAIPDSEPLLRAQQAVYLVATSPQFQVER